jgi:hypothetical protein
MTGIDRVEAFVVGAQASTILVAARVVTAMVIGMPEFDGCSLDELCPGVENTAGDLEGETCVTGGTQQILLGSTFPVERPEDLGWGGLESSGLSSLPGREKVLLRKTAEEKPPGDAEFERLAPVELGHDC